MVGTIIYFHGFASSSDSKKAKLIKKYISKNHRKVTIYTPDLSNNFEEAIYQIKSLIKKSDEQIAFMGSSLGGYYALYFSQKLNTKAILINPAIPPLDGFDVYLGENENYSTGEKFILTGGNCALSPIKSIFLLMFGVLKSQYLKKSSNRNPDPNLKNSPSE